MSKKTYTVELGCMTKENESWNADGMKALAYSKEFETLEEARADFDELDPRAEFLKEYDATNGAWMLMRRAGYFAEIYTEDDSVDFKSYTYDDYKEEFE